MHIIHDKICQCPFLYHEDNVTKTDLCKSPDVWRDLYLAPERSHKTQCRIADTPFIFLQCCTKGILVKPLPACCYMCYGFIFLQTVWPECEHHTQFVVQKPLWPA